MAEMFMEKMHAFGNLLQDEWQVLATPETHLPKIPLERITLFQFFGVLSAWTKFMIKQYCKSIGVKKKRKQDVIAFVNTVTQFIHRGSYAHIVTVVRKFS